MSRKEIIGIIGAMDAEIEEYLKHLRDAKQTTWQEFIFYQGVLFDQNVVIVKGGVGKVLTAMITQKMIDLFCPDKIIFTGVAGAINKNYKIGDVVISKDCVQHDLNAAGLGFERGEVPYTDYKIFKADSKLFKIALETKLDNKIYQGRVLTGDQFFTHKELADYQSIIDELQGDAVEMEGAALAQVCVVNKIPWLIVRTISDNADQDATDNFNKFLPIIAKNSFVVIKHILKNLL